MQTKIISETLKKILNKIIFLINWHKTCKIIVGILLFKKDFYSFVAQIKTGVGLSTLEKKIRFTFHIESYPVSR